MLEAELADRLKRIGRSAGLDAVGITSAKVLEPARTVLHSRKAAGLAATMNFTYRNPDRSTDVSRALPGAQSIIAGAMSYWEPDSAFPDELSGRVARYSWTDKYEDLRAALRVVADELVVHGYRAQVHCDDNSVVDRSAAYRAGLGSYGKNANLLIPEAGSWFVLGSVVTDAVLPGNIEPQSDQCGPCQRCFDGCPTKAIVGPGIIDARRCLAWLVQAEGPIPTEFREALGDRIYGCDECQEVCPPNREQVAARSIGLGFADTGDQTERVPGEIGPGNGEVGEQWVPIAWLLNATDNDLLGRVGRWYIAKRDPAVVRRTALVVLGNTGDPNDPEVIHLLGKYLGHENPLLRAHAVWACRRLGLDQLLEVCVDDPDDDVRGELENPVTSRFGPP